MQPNAGTVGVAAPTLEFVTSEKKQPRPRASGWFEPTDETIAPLIVALGRLVLSAAVLEKTLHLELARVHYERAQASGDPAGYGLDAILVATEQLTGGQARSQLEVLGLPADLNARIRDAIERRNAVLHRPMEDPDFARAVGTGEGLETVVERIGRLALDCGELGVELERFAGDRLAAMIGMSREQIAQVVATLDPATIPDERMRAQLEAVKASGIDFSKHPYPPQ
jgi:hypothetical protein